MADYLTPEDIRNFILDRSIADNDLQLDLTFSEDEVMDAMKRAAREFNSIAPYSMTADPMYLENDTNMFLDGTAAQLYLSRLSKLTRNDIDYTAGGVSTNLVVKQIGHLKDLIKMHTERFMEVARNKKVFTNLLGAYIHFN